MVVGSGWLWELEVCWGIGTKSQLQQHRRMSNSVRDVGDMRGHLLYVLHMRCSTCLCIELHACIGPCLVQKNWQQIDFESVRQTLVDTGYQPLKLGH